MCNTFEFHMNPTLVFSEQHQIMSHQTHVALHHCVYFLIRAYYYLRHLLSCLLSQWKHWFSCISGRTLFALFWQQLRVKKQLSIFDASPPVLSSMSKLSWRLSRHVGESTSIFQRFLSWLFIDVENLLRLKSSDGGPLQLYSLYKYLRILYSNVHGYKICRVTICIEILLYIIPQVKTKSMGDGV